MTLGTNPIALITGGSRGLGKNMAIRLAKEGADIVLTYRTGEAEAKEVVSTIKKLGRKAVALPLDVAQSASFAAFEQSLEQALLTHFGRKTFDFLINNAGIGIHASVADTTEAQFDSLVNTHLKGPFFLTQRLLARLTDGGRILFLSTGLTRFAFPGYAVYGAVKGGVEVFAKYLAKELGPRQITVNVLAPGAIETDFGGGVVRDNPQVNRMIASTTALGRVGLPEDIGAACVVLLSKEAGWITGQRIEVSGGMNL